MTITSDAAQYRTWLGFRTYFFKCFEMHLKKHDPRAESRDWFWNAPLVGMVIGKAMQALYIIKVVSRVLELDNYKFVLNEYRSPLNEVRDSL